MGHQNIVRGVSKWENKEPCRDFETLEEHDRIIINNINKTVGEDDNFYIAGDFVMGGKDNIPIFRKMIKCKNIILIKGNHDLHMHKNSVVHDGQQYINVNSLFKRVSDIEDIKIGHTKIVMCHYPIFSWHRKNKGSIHLYGHTHKELGYDRQAICISLECHPEFRPFSLNEIKNIYNEKTHI